MSLIYLHKTRLGPAGKPGWVLRWPDTPDGPNSLAAKVSLSFLCRSGAAFFDTDGVVYVVEPFRFASTLRRTSALHLASLYSQTSQSWTLSMGDTRALARTVIRDRYDLDVANGTRDHRQLADLKAYFESKSLSPSALLERYAATTGTGPSQPLMPGWRKNQWILAEKMYNDGGIHVREIRDYINSIC